MSISVKFFASLREQIGISEQQLEIDTPTPVIDVWRQSTGQSEIPDNILCAVNMEYVDTEQLAKDGDEVAFFPPVTGG